MGLYRLIIALQIVNAYSASKIFLPDGQKPLTIAAANIVDKCFGSSERWSELLIISDHDSREIIGEIHRASKMGNSILFFNNAKNNELIREDYSNTSVVWQDTKPTSVIIVTDGLKRLVSVLSFLKNDNQRIWRPESYFFIVLEISCDLAECNDMLKVTWDYWILNAVILCSSNGGIELYTFNPYSGDHPRKWETIIHETVQVSINPGNFNHSWYIFKLRSNYIRSFEYCGDIFFDKTLNLDGYVVPISFSYPEFLSDTTETGTAKAFAPDSRTFRTISKKLRFDIVQVVNYDLNVYGQLHKNGSYSGMMRDVYKGRSYLAPTYRGIKIYPGLGMTYPHDVSSACFASRIVGNRPQWTNLAVAKYILIGCGIGLIFSTAVLYMINKSHGIVSAFLDAERMFIGTSIIHTTTFVKHRIILGSIFLVVLVVDGAIRGRFISILTIVRPYPNLDTFDQLNEQNVDVYGNDIIKEAIIDPLIKARLKFCFEATKCLERLEHIEHQQAYIADCRSFELYALNSSNIHISSTSFRTSYVTYLTTLHWPMANRYSDEVQKLVEAGISKKWRSDVVRDSEIAGWKIKRAAEQPYVRSTKLNDLLPAFLLLFIGLLASLMAFAWELVDELRSQAPS